MSNCRFCGKFFENRSMGGHTRVCDLNPKKYDIKTSKRPKKLSEEHKASISRGRRKFLEENPDQIPYKLYHSSKMSWPEKFFQDALERHKIVGWKYNFTAGIYCYDFAFPELKIDVEVDGSTHDLAHVKKIDEVRDQWTFNQGWRVLRINAKVLYRDADFVISELLNFIGSNQQFYRLGV